MGHDWTRLADYLRDEMDQRGWTQHDLAHHAGVGTRMVYRLLSGHGFERWPYKMPRIERAVEWEPGTARRIAEGGSPDAPANQRTEDRDAELEAALARFDKLNRRQKHRAYMRVLAEWVKYQQEIEDRDAEREE